MDNQSAQHTTPAIITLGTLLGAPTGQDLEPAFYLYAIENDAGVRLHMVFVTNGEDSGYRYTLKISASTSDEVPNRFALSNISLPRANLNSTLTVSGKRGVSNDLVFTGWVGGERGRDGLEFDYPANDQSMRFELGADRFEFPASNVLLGAAMSPLSDHMHDDACFEVLLTLKQPRG